MTIDLKRQSSSLDDAVNLLREEEERAKKSIRIYAEKAIDDLRAQASVLGTVERVSDLLARAEVALVNDVALPEGSQHGRGLDIRADYNCYTLIAPNSSVALTPGRKRVLFFILPQEEPKL